MDAEIRHNETLPPRSVPRPRAPEWLRRVIVDGLGLEINYDSIADNFVIEYVASRFPRRPTNPRAFSNFWTTVHAAMNAIPTVLDNRTNMRIVHLYAAVSRRLFRQFDVRIDVAEDVKLADNRRSIFEAVYDMVSDLYVKTVIRDVDGVVFRCDTHIGSDTPRRTRLCRCLRLAPTLSDHRYADTIERPQV